MDDVKFSEITLALRLLYLRAMSFAAWRDGYRTAATDTWPYNVVEGAD